MLCWPRIWSWMLSVSPLRVVPTDQAHYHEERDEWPCVCLVFLYPVELFCEFSVAHYIMCLSVYSIITVPERRIPCRPLLWLSWCPKHVLGWRTSDRPGSPILSPRPCVACWCLTSCTFWVYSTTCFLRPFISWCPYKFCFILSPIRWKNNCYIDIGAMCDGVGIVPLSHTRSQGCHVSDTVWL